MLQTPAARLLPPPLLLAVGAAACDGADPASAGRLTASLAVDAVGHDVSAMSYKVVAKGQTCDAAAIAERLVPAVMRTGHPLFDAFFVLPAGDYHVCATPMAGETRSQICGRAEADATVTP